MQTMALIGNCGADPQVKEFSNGNKIVTFNVGDTERGYTTREGKVVPDRTEWFRCEAYGPRANYIQQYLHKGDLVAVLGKFRTEEYEKDGERKNITKLVVDDIKIYNKR